MTDLKPCPFCGNTNLYIQMTKESGCDDQYQVICNFNWNGCGASSGYWDTPQEAVDAWNRRVSNDNF